MPYFYTAVVLGVGIGWLGGASRPPVLVMYGSLPYWRTSRFKRFWLDTPPGEPWIGHAIRTASPVAMAQGPRVQLRMG